MELNSFSLYLSSPTPPPFSLLLFLSLKSVADLTLSCLLSFSHSDAGLEQSGLKNNTSGLCHPHTLIPYSLMANVLF